MIPEDIDLFKFDLEEVWKTLRTGVADATEFRRLRLHEDLAALTKRFINEKAVIEDRLTPKGIEALSQAMFAVDWAAIYYVEQSRQLARRERGYWKTLWLAILWETL